MNRQEFTSVLFGLGIGLFACAVALTMSVTFVAVIAAAKVGIWILTR